MPFRHLTACVLVLIVGSVALATGNIRYVVAHDYRVGGGSLADTPAWRSISWVWRSEADRQACRRSLFTDPAPRRSDPLGTPACVRARLTAVDHRSAVEVLPPDPACGALTTIRFRPSGQDRLSQLNGCIEPRQLSDDPARLDPGVWVFVVDVHELTEEPAPQLRRIGDYPSWTDCESIRLTVRDDLAKEQDAEASDGAKLAAAGTCLPDELLE
jgi:hypothetical protein